MIVPLRPIRGNFPVRDRRVFVRVDHNVPLNADGSIRNDARIVQTVGTVRSLRDRGARVILLSHLGYPGGIRDPRLSTRCLSDRLSEHLGHAVIHMSSLEFSDVLTAVERLSSGDVLYLENSRFYPGEEVDSIDLARYWASLGDICINDAFSVAHRRHASIHGLSRLLPTYAGPTLREELDRLRVLHTSCARRGIVLGGTKVIQKLQAISRIDPRGDTLCIGGLAAIFVAQAIGWPTGTTRIGSDEVRAVPEVWSTIARKDFNLQLPVDWIARDADGRCRPIDAMSVPTESTIVDVGPRTTATFAALLARTEIIFWNGPLGIYEESASQQGTQQLANALGELRRNGVQVLAGGGDTLASIAVTGTSDCFTHQSSGGGACLAFLSAGMSLPGLRHLCKSPDADSF